MDVTEHRFDKKSTDDLVFPTDAAALVFGILIFFVMIRSRTFLADPDIYWHIATGKWIWAERAFPRHDVFSHTAFGQPWVNMEWLAQITLYLTYDLFGWSGLVLLCGTVITLTFVILYKFLSQELRPTVALGAAAVSCQFASIQFLARPHLLTFPIIVVWTASLARASEENRRPSLWLLPLMVLWANLHGGFTVGLVLAAGFGLEATMTAAPAERRRLAIQWLGFWISALLAGCVTPYGYHYLLQTYYVFGLGELMLHIGELRPMNPYTEFKQEVILLCLLTLALLFGAKIGIIRLLMIVGLLHFSLQHVRGLAIFALVLPLVIAHPLQRQFAFLRPTRDPFPLFDTRRFRPLVTTVALMATIFVGGALGTAYVAWQSDDAPTNYFSPTAALDHAMTANLTGPVLNDYDFGGYLVFRGIPTFIDGRTLPFGKDFTLKFLEAFSFEGTSKLEQLADAYKVSWTLLRTQSPAALHFDHSPDWRRIYADDVAVVHVRR